MPNIATILNLSAGASAPVSEVSGTIHSCHQWASQPSKFGGPAGSRQQIVITDGTGQLKVKLWDHPPIPETSVGTAIFISAGKKSPMSKWDNYQGKNEVILDVKAGCVVTLAAAAQQFASPPAQAPAYAPPAQPTLPQQPAYAPAAHAAPAGVTWKSIGEHVKLEGALMALCWIKVVKEVKPAVRQSCDYDMDEDDCRSAAMSLFISAAKRGLPAAPWSGYAGEDPLANPAPTPVPPVSEDDVPY